LTRPGGTATLTCMPALGPRPGGGPMNTAVARARGHRGGSVAPGFEEVQAEFDRNFAERGEIGATVAAYWRGERVVDRWGGRRRPTARPPGRKIRWSLSTPAPGAWRR